MNVEKALGALLEELEYRINSTPTGPKRDQLTKVNVYLMLTLDAYKKSQATPASGTRPAG